MPDETPFSSSALLLQQLGECWNTAPVTVIRGRVVRGWSVRLPATRQEPIGCDGRLQLHALALRVLLCRPVWLFEQDDIGVRNPLDLSEQS
jgi:hypothetical protein